MRPDTILITEWSADEGGEGNDYVCLRHQLMKKLHVASIPANNL